MTLTSSVQQEYIDWSDSWHELDKKALTAIQLCLVDEVLDKFSMEK